MGVLQRCSKLVFRCFKCVEKTADAVTGAVGPVFITLAVVLISLGVFTFFATIAPTLRFPILSIPICLLLATNLLAQYFYVCTVSPGFIEDDPISTTQDRDALHWAKRSPASGATWSERRLAGDANRSPQQCRKCMKPRPERAHHCSVCKRCILKYDHHCPWINQCVGLRNERHFVLFMAYLSLCCGSFVFLGWSLIWDAIKFEDWDYYAPRTAFILTYVLAIAIGFSVSVMLLWQVYMLSSGETAVENSDNGRYTRLAKRRGTTFINSFDLGRRKNLELFFNIGPTGYPAWTLLFPLRVPPYTDGWTWARRPGMTEHEGITVDDELTDDDDD